MGKRDFLDGGILSRLEEWQRAMDATVSCLKQRMNRYHCKTYYLELKGAYPERTGTCRDDDRWIEKNQDSFFDVWDQEVLDLKKEVPVWYQDYTNRRFADGVWTHDWENHEHHQEFLKMHPNEIEPGRIVPDLEDTDVEEEIDPEDQLDIDGWMEYIGWNGGEEDGINVED
jgi:hypothetical protein